MGFADEGSVGGAGVGVGEEGDERLEVGGQVVQGVAGGGYGEFFLGVGGAGLEEDFGLGGLLGNTSASAAHFFGTTMTAESAIMSGAYVA